MENEEEMTFMVQLPADFPLADLQQIALMLEEADVFVPGYIPPDVGMYHLMGYFYGSMVDNVSIILLPDRNIVSRLAKATSGCKADDQQRLAPFVATIEDPALDRLAAALTAWWPMGQARTIADRLSDFFQRYRDTVWYEQQRNSPNAIPDFIAQGEARLRAWSPVIAGSAGKSTSRPGTPIQADYISASGASWLLLMRPVCAGTWQ